MKSNFIRCFIWAWLLMLFAVPSVVQWHCTAEAEELMAAVSGNVTDAVTATPLAGVTVTIGELSGRTDDNGNYVIDNIPPAEFNANFYANITSGNAPLLVQFTDTSTDNAYTLTAIRDGYDNYVNTRVIVGADGAVVNFSMNPKIVENSGGMRFVLNWVADNQDIDLYLQTPIIEGGANYNIYWDNMGSQDSAPYATLDQDVIYGYGPETITITKLFDGTYYLYVNLYYYWEWTVGTLSTSQASVQIYNDQGLIQTLNVPESGEGMYWNVAQIDGATGSVTIINQIQESEPGLIRTRESLKKLLSSNETRRIMPRSSVGWLWNFGDGSTSTEQNPEHKYQTPGKYTVSLTVNNDQGETDTLTKTDYITVIDDVPPPTCDSDPLVTYTTKEDFASGNSVGVDYNTVPGELTISSESTTLPFIWIPNSDDGTISKVDTRDGKELGRYHVGPSSANSSRTTVDMKGNCWVANRGAGTAVKVGLVENGQYDDRNGNGKIDTSKDTNGDGIISGDEILPWGEDEAVLFEVILIPGNEGTYVPGKYTGGYVANYPRAVAVDVNNNIWAGVYDTKTFYYIEGTNGKIIRKVDISSVGHSPYGAVLDRNGILWSSGWGSAQVLRLNPADDSFKTIALSHGSYGLGLDKNSNLYVSGYSYGKFSKINTTTNEVIWTKSTGGGDSRGIAITDQGDVWIANSGSNTVTRLSSDGELLATIPVGSTPTGVAVDAAGKVWAVGIGTSTVYRINPEDNTVDLTKDIAGSHYGYSDMTGIIARTSTTRLGTWSVIYDSGAETKWDCITWQASQPEGTVIKARARVSENTTDWSVWHEVIDGLLPTEIPTTRYIQIELTMQVLSGEQIPVLYDTTISGERESEPIPRGTAMRTISGTNVSIAVTLEPGVLAWTLEEYIPEGLTPTLTEEFNADWNPNTRLITWYGSRTLLEADNQEIFTLKYQVEGEEGEYTVSGEANFSDDPTKIVPDTLVTGDTIITIIGQYHPADIDRDWNIIQGETAAYLAGWQENPLIYPDNYVGRAIYIWRSGEAYTRKPDSVPPECWVPVNNINSNMTAVRSVNDVVRTINGTTVTITINPPLGTLVWLYKETLPEGLTPTNITGANGKWSESTRMITWNKSSSSELSPTTLSYTVSGQSGSYTLEGRANFNGSIEYINASGETEITIIDTLVLNPNNNSTRILSGASARVYGSGDNNVILSSGAEARLINFHGNNVITILSSSDGFIVLRSGAMVTFKNTTNKTVLIIPATKTIQTIKFNNKSFDLIIKNDAVMLNDQVIGLDEQTI